MSTFVLKNVVLSYPHLVNPNDKIQNSDGKGVYTACLLIDKNDKQVDQLNTIIKEEAKRALQKKWEGKAPKQVSPLKDGDGTKDNGESYGDECKNRWILNVKANEQPRMVDEFKKPCYDERKFYPGCRVHVQLSMYGYNVNGKKGLTTKIVNVMWAGDDVRLGGDMSPEEAFADIPTATPTVETTTDFGLQDDLPF